MSDIPNYSDFKISEEYSAIINMLEEYTQHEAYNLLKLLNGTDIQIATSESLTAGLIMSTLVKIPWAGWHKYGCTGVYDTDAKRVFNSVMVDDVYTHTCAKEMAIGLLNNSNATLTLAVTGNAMPYMDDAFTPSHI
jgi:nicotinamide mononucleotide (NMN) deamidase PncC